MTKWRFVLSRRWLGYLAFAIAFAIACVFLSNWQLARSKEAAHDNAVVSANFYSKPAPLPDVLPQLSTYNSNLQWKRFTATGTYEVSKQLLVRNRSDQSGSVGVEVLTPLRLTDGAILIVDRGFISDSASGKSVFVPAPPKGRVTVTARVKPGEPAIQGQSWYKNTVPTIHLASIARYVGGDVYTGSYGLLNTQTPAATKSLTAVVSTPPNEDEGLHWSYMIQWLIFAAIGFFGFGYAVRTEYRKIHEDDPEEQARAAERDRKRALKRTDADEEDALLDAVTR